MSDRPYLVRDLAAVPPRPTDVRARVVRDDELEAISELMVEAYRGTIDYEGEEAPDALEELLATAAGDSGPALRDSWLVVEGEDGSLASAIVTIRWMGVPFVSYVFTRPESKQRGLATALVETVAAAVVASGETTLSLFVTRASPALALYQRLGFVETQPPAE